MIRFRPKDHPTGPMYMPSADVTRILPKIISVSLTSLEEYPALREELGALAESLGGLIMRAHDPARSWEADALPALTKLLEGVGPEAEKAFMRQFMMSMLDLYWHSVRGCPDDPTLPKDLEKGLATAAMLRVMPKKFREEYLEHTRTVNALPACLD